MPQVTIPFTLPLVHCLYSTLHGLGAALHSFLLGANQDAGSSSHHVFPGRRIVNLVSTLFGPTSFANDSCLLTAPCVAVLFTGNFSIISCLVRTSTLSPFAPMKNTTWQHLLPSCAAGNPPTETPQPDFGLAHLRFYGGGALGKAAIHHSAFSYRTGGTALDSTFTQRSQAAFTAAPVCAILHAPALSWL